MVETKGWFPGCGWCSILLQRLRKAIKMPPTPPARLDPDLYAFAKVMGDLLSRSTAQQLSHWARIGREFEAGNGVNQEHVTEVLSGTRDYDVLSASEQAVIRAAWSEQIASRAAQLNMGALIHSRGLDYVTADAKGNVVHHPAPSRGVTVVLLGADGKLERSVMPSTGKVKPAAPKKPVKSSKVPVASSAKAKRTAVAKVAKVSRASKQTAVRASR